MENLNEERLKTDRILEYRELTGFESIKISED